MPVHAWIYSKHNRVGAGIAMMRLTAGWPINWALTKPKRKPIIWRHSAVGGSGSSVFRGVTKKTNYFFVQIKLKADDKSGKRKAVYVGTHRDEYFAAAMYNVAARNIHGAAARLNLM